MRSSTFWLGCLAVAWPAGAQDHPVRFAVGGCGGAWLQADPGELIVELEKRDRNLRGAPTELRALLFGPDRRVLDEQLIPFAGQAKGSGPGPAQRCTLRARVERAGVHGLCVTVANDRYGDDIIWGLWTNCPHWLVETARGHRDARHEEPIVLLDPERPGEVCFRPRYGAFQVEVEGVPADVPELTLHDQRGQVVARLPLTGGKASAELPADRGRDEGPWRLHFPKAKGVLKIDGLTRWDDQDLLRDQCVWTPDAGTWFPWSDHRWLVTPYAQRRYGRAGERAEAVFELHNNALRECVFKLSLEYPDGAWPVELETAQVAVPARRAVETRLRYTVPDRERVVHLRATADDGPAFTTFATLRVEPGEAAAGKPLDLPLRLRPYVTENLAFGYQPSYALDNQPYFDATGRAFVTSSGGLWTSDQPGGRTAPLNVVERVPAFDGAIGLSSTKVAIDREGDVYLLGASGSRRLLLHSADHGASFRAYVIPGHETRGRGLDFEQFSGHNLPDGPPPVARNTAVPTPRDAKTFWRRVNELDLFVPRKVAGRIEIGEPIPISKQSLGLSGHSGMPSSIVSRGAKVHIVWGEATDPASPGPGVPTLVTTWDRDTRTLGRPVLVGHGAPPNDVHNTPSITLDGDGFLHVLTGTHGRPFGYAKSLQPNDSQAGFSPAEQTGGDLGQTYIGLVCGPDGTLHLVYRLNQYRIDPSPVSYHTALAYQRKRPGQPWEPPLILVRPAFSEYSVYYHRLTIDHRGRLYLSYEYWSTFWFYRNDQRLRRRAVLMSEDGGGTWRLW